MYERPDWSLFRNLHTLGQKAGVPRHRLAALAVKELTDNALDAGAMAIVGDLADHRKAPGCSGYFVQDDGPGIDGSDEDIARIFSINRPLVSSKLVRLPTRGALGNGCRVVAGCVLASGGFLYVTTKGRELALQPMDDGSTAVVSSRPSSLVGTRIEIGFGGDLSTQDGLWMAKLAVAMRGESFYTGSTNAYWYSSDDFFEMSQASSGSVLGLLATFDCRGFKAERDISLSAENAERYANSLTREECDALLGALRFKTKEVKPDKLGQVGEHVFAAAGYSKKTATFARRATLGKHHATIPAVIEVWARKSPTASANVYINRTPITAVVNSGMNGGREGRQWISGCGLYHTFKTGRDPMHFTIVVTSPHMPIVTDGKEPDLSVIAEEIGEALTSAARKAKVAARVNGEVRESQQEMIFGFMDDAIAHASNNGKTPFSLRRLFYAMRPMWLAKGAEVTYNYFCTCVGKYENAIGEDVPMMYRDARGSIKHPHDSGYIPLGTINVAAYKRPKWRYCNALYIEKGGPFPLLEAEKWAERHDCLLFTSQGQGTRAAKDLIDMIGSGDEPLEIFLVHDADAYGTCILEGMLEATLARPGRQVKVTNLGLDPWEAKEMGLAHENVDKKGDRKVPVAQYVRDYDRRNYTDWESWLQSHRYELDAMTSRRFIEWLDAKFEKHAANRKVIPPEDVMTTQFKASVHAKIRDTLIRDAIVKMDIEARANEIAGEVSLPYDILGMVGEALEDDRTLAWTDAIEERAIKAATDEMRWRL